MLIGQTFISSFVGDATNESKLVYTPWFPRQGDALTSHIDVINLGTDAGVVLFGWGLYHKDSEAVGEGTLLTATSGTVTSTSTGVFSWRCTGCKELVRYSVLLGIVPAAVGPGSAFAHFRFLAPSWETNGAQSI